jgi:hypothetical protein
VAVDEEGRQLILWLEARAAERDGEFQQLLKRLEAQAREFRRWLDETARESRERHAEAMSRLEDLREEDRAQRAALFQILDRLGGPGAASA